METLRLLITDTSFIISSKGKSPLEKTFASDEECFSLLTQALSKQKKVHIECFFSGSRIISQSRTVTYAPKEAFVVDEKTIKLLVESTQHAFIEDHKEQSLDIIQSEILEMSLNGYPVAVPKKQEVHDLSITILFVALPIAYKKKLITALGHLAPHSSFSAFAWFQAKHVREISKKDEFMICAAYELSTDISIRKKNGFFEIASIPLGTHHALEQSEKGLQPEWFQSSLDEEIKKTLNKLCDGISLPSNTYLMVAPAFQKQYEEAFKGDSYHSVCFSDKGFEVVHMSSILNT